MQTDATKLPSAGQGTLWAYVQNWAARGISLLVFFTLARLLTPAEFGAFAVSMVFLTLGEIFVEQLFSHAIVQRHELLPEHLNAAFWATLVVGSVIAGGTLLGASWFAQRFGSPEISPLIMALSPVFAFMAVSSVPASMLRRRLDYRTLAKRSTLSNLTSGLVAIVAAWAGLGVWAFVLQLLCFHWVGTYVLWHHEKWRPQWQFSFERLHDVSGFSVRITAVKLLDMIETRVVELLVGRWMGLTALGHYALASRAYQAAVQLLAAPLWDSSLGVFSRLQAQREELIAVLQQRAFSAALIIAPLFLFAAASAELLVPAVFGAKWHEAVPAFQVLCMLGMVRAVSFLYGGMLQSIGADKASLKIATLRAAATLASVLGFFKLGTAGVAAGLLAGQLLVLPFVFHVIRSRLELNAMQLVRNIAKPLVAALASAGLGLWFAKTMGPALPYALGATLTLALCALIFAGLLTLLMPRTLAQSLMQLPPPMARIPLQVIDGVARAQDWVRVQMVFAAMARAVPTSHRSLRTADVVLVMPDAYSNVGSVGDQALFGGLVAMLRWVGVVRVRILCRPHVVVPQVEGVSFTALPYWGERQHVKVLTHELKNARALVVIGADTIDGFYSRYESLMRLGMLAFCAQRGVPSMLCSFSFNDQADLATRRALAKLPMGVSLLCRDDFSRERVAQLVGDRVQLTADLGFLLEPSTQGVLAARVAAWLHQHRHPTGPVIGWNLSPHSLKLLTLGQQAQAVAASAQVISRLMTEHDATVVLLPHDFRPHASDPELLAQVHAQLPEAVRARVLLPLGPYTAAEVKQCCAHFDLVFTGRMHLMIAALGCDVPAMAIEYQGKFAGVLKHFGLGQDALVTALQACDAELLYRTVVSQLQLRASTKAQIQARRPAVEALSSAAIARCLTVFE